jgi:hypothetical protein
VTIVTSANPSEPIPKFKFNVSRWLSQNRSLIYQSFNQSYRSDDIIFSKVLIVRQSCFVTSEVRKCLNSQSFVRSFISTVDFYNYLRCNLSEDWNQVASINCCASLILKELLSVEYFFHSLFIVCQLVPHPSLRHPEFFGIRFVFIGPESVYISY